MVKTGRRRFVLSAGASLVAAPRVLAQSGARTYRVATVIGSSVDLERDSLDAFTQRLHAHGYRTDENLKLDVSYADGRTDRVSALIQEAVARRPDAIVLRGSHAAAMARKATSSIPIVMVTVGDPVALALAASLARPGGNVTGNTIQDSAFVPKALELLHEALPGVRSIAVLTDPAMPATRLQWASVEGPARKLELVLERHDASTPEEIDRVFGVFARRRPAALQVFPVPLFSAQRRKLITSATRERIPAMLCLPDSAGLGALMSYFVNIDEMWRNAANFVHRILQGAKPGDLPFEQASRFDFNVNLKTAKALGITIPQAVLLRADRVFE